MNVCIVVGAGATLCEAQSGSVISRPPLDRRFFRDMGAARRQREGLTYLWGHLAQYYGLSYDTLPESQDSLEYFTAMLYAASFMTGTLGDDSYRAFRALVVFFVQYLSETTNRLSAGRQSPLQRLMRKIFESDVDPDDVSFVTFNQDLQIEKAISAMSRVERWRQDGLSFRIPERYGIQFSSTLTSSRANPQFATTPTGSCPTVLKLHGSLNWVSSHTSVNASRTALYNPNRAISYVSAINIPGNFRLRSRGGHQSVGFPVVVPPVPHKGALIPVAMSGLWANAEDALSSADQIIVFGYSCPEADHEASDMIRRSLNSGNWSDFVVINPDPSSAARFAELSGRKKLRYFGSLDAFLADD